MKLECISNGKVSKIEFIGILTNCFESYEMNNNSEQLEAEFEKYIRNNYNLNILGNKINIVELLQENSNMYNDCYQAWLQEEFDLFAFDGCPIDIDKDFNEDGVHEFEWFGSKIVVIVVDGEFEVFEG